METVAERIGLRLAELTPAERKVVRTLMAEYPVLGLEPVAKLAAAAGVSAPTVIRLVSKLSFDSYADFQQSLKSEVSARLSSPLAMHAERQAGTPGDALSRAAYLLCDGIRTSFARLPRSEFDEAVRLLADHRRAVTLVGGRFSSMLAEYLAAHLRVLRSGVHVVSCAGADRMSALLDVGRRDILVAFDYRRYQHDTVKPGDDGKGAGRDADRVHRSVPVAAGCPRRRDPDLERAVAVAVRRAHPGGRAGGGLIAALVDRLGDGPRARMARYDALYAGTVDEAARAQQHVPRRRTVSGD